uniref:L1 transposable element RRM domain-containing protein n=1 Tax=Latimeria chalumnae TaxID=7897 RepID=H2ZUU3_LATCH
PIQTPKVNNKCKKSNPPSPASPEMASTKPAENVPSGDVQQDIQSIFTILNKIASDTSTITSNISEINSKLDNIDKRLDETENHVAKLEDHVEEELGKTTEIETKLTKAWAIEKGRPIDFLNCFLPELPDLPEDLTLRIERAHRSLAPLPRSQQRPRLIIMCLLEFQTQVLLLRKAADRSRICPGKDIKYVYFKISLGRFRGKGRLLQKGRGHGIKYMMAYRIILRVQRDGKQHNFQDPVKVLAFV